MINSSKPDAPKRRVADSIPANVIGRMSQAVQKLAEVNVQPLKYGEAPFSFDERGSASRVVGKLSVMRAAIPNGYEQVRAAWVTDASAREEYGAAFMHAPLTRARQQGRQIPAPLLLGAVDFARKDEDEEFSGALTLVQTGDRGFVMLQSRITPDHGVVRLQEGERGDRYYNAFAFAARLGLGNVWDSQREGARDVVESGDTAIDARNAVFMAFELGQLASNPSRRPGGQQV